MPFPLLLIPLIKIAVVAASGSAAVGGGAKLLANKKWNKVDSKKARLNSIIKNAEISYNMKRREANIWVNDVYSNMKNLELTLRSELSISADSARNNNDILPVTVQNKIDELNKLLEENSNLIKQSLSDTLYSSVSLKMDKPTTLQMAHLAKTDPLTAITAYVSKASFEFASRSFDDLKQADKAFSELEQLERNINGEIGKINDSFNKNYKDTKQTLSLFETMIREMPDCSYHEKCLKHKAIVTFIDSIKEKNT